MASPPSSPLHSKKPKLSPNPTERPAVPPSPSSGKPRYKRRKIALFFGYCGHGYQGMQKNPGAKTIEADLEEALFHAWAVPEPDRGNPRRCEWARSARTDKGVSAVGQVVSGRFYVDPPGLIERVNSFLDPRIRVFGYKRVTASFDAKKFCDRRRYVYLLPVFALDRKHGVCLGEERSELDRQNDDGLVTEVRCSGENGDVVVAAENKLQNQTGELNGGSFVSDARLSVSEAEGMVSNHAHGDGDVATTVVGEGNFVREHVVGTLHEKNESGSVEKQDREKNVGVIDDNGDEVVATENKSENGSVENQTRERNGGALVSDVRLPVHEGEGMVSNHAHGDGNKAIAEVLEEGDTLSVDHTSSKFCYGEEEKRRFNEILKRYVGTHNFHNFTSRTKAQDPSAQRYILSFSANTVVDVEGVRFVKCEVLGQSFVLHQIRKMIGLAVAIMRNCTSESLMDSVFSKDVKVNVPIAPEIGLYLDECLFTSYNKKWQDHEVLSMDSFAKEAEDFKVKHIYSHIASMEKQEGAMAQWLETLNGHRYYDPQTADKTTDNV